ncbi:MAG: ribosomal RNA small subunit methyltransferase A [Chloroflexi bacterium]|nr:ribosomal RNA small subunit methyltransferase A [Chloroflexota bacterium]
MTLASSTQRGVRDTLRRLGLSPRKALGQHFLVDRRALGRILEAADLKPDDTVVEVGPGLGVLTQALAGRCGRVLAVELDRELAEALGRAFADTPHVTVLNADAREIDPWELLPPDTPYKVVANLPYYAANPILRRFLEAARKPSLLVITVQREVAQNIAAPPGKLGLLGVSVQLYGKPRIAGYLRPSAFHPPPKVTSAILRIDVYPKLAVDVTDVEAFFQLARAGFSAPRKQLRGALAHSLGLERQKVEALLVRAGVDPTRRAETLSLEEWARLERCWQERRGG